MPHSSGALSTDWIFSRNKHRFSHCGGGGDAAFYPAYAIVIERHHMTLYIVLLCCRIMVLNLLNLYTLIFALFGKISLMVRNVYTLDFHRLMYHNVIL